MRFIKTLIKDSGILLVATMGTNVANGLFQLIMGSMLEPRQFGILTSLLSLFLIISVPVMAMQTMTTKYVANFKAVSDYAKIKQLLVSSTKYLIASGAVLSLAMVAGSGSIAAFFKLRTAIPVLLIAASLFLSLILPVGRGVLQGLQRFNLLGFNILAATLTKLLVAIVLVYLGYGAVGALLGIVIGPIIAIVLILPLLTKLLQKYPSGVNINLRKIYSFFWPTMITILCFNLLISADIIIVKHFFSPVWAGYYAGIVTMGKVVLFLPLAITMVMFAKSAESHTKEEDTLADLKRYLLIIGFLSGAVTLIYFIIPRPIMGLIGFGKYLPLAYLVGYLGVAMTFFALNNTLLLYQLSVHRLKFIWLLVGSALTQVVIIWFYHPSLTAVVLIMLINGILLFVGNSVIVFGGSRLILLKARILGLIN